MMSPRRLDFGHLVDVALDDDGAGHAADGLHGGGSVAVRVVPIEPGWMIRGQLEHVVVARAGHDVNHRRLGVSRSQRLEQMGRDVEPVHVQVGRVQLMGNVVVARPAAGIIGGQRVLHADPQRLSWTRDNRWPRHLPVVAAQLRTQAVQRLVMPLCFQSLEAGAALAAGCARRSFHGPHTACGQRRRHGGGPQQENFPSIYRARYLGHHCRLSPSVAKPCYLSPAFGQTAGSACGFM